MATCASATGRWTTGTVDTNNVETESINSFLGVSQMYGDGISDGFFQPSEVTDISVKSNATWARLAAVAVATLNTVTAIKIADKQYDIAKAYYDIANENWERFKDSYMPCERKEMAEACTTDEYEANYDDQASNYMQSAKNAFASANARMEDLFSRYCLCDHPDIARDMAFIESQIVGDSGNFAYRYEEYRELEQSDRRWTRRQQALNRGRDIQAMTQKYASAASDAYGDIGDSVNGAAQGAMKALGYFSNRNETRYPQRSQESISSDGVWAASNPTGTNGQDSFINSGLMDNHNLVGYSNAITPYSTNDAITSTIGNQTTRGA